MRILVSAASRYGSTAEMAEAIGERLVTHGHDVLVRAPEAVDSLEGIDAVVLASGVYAGRWLRPARSFIKRMAADLRERPVWLMSSGPVGDTADTSPEPLDITKMIKRTQAHGHVVLPGRMDRANLHLPDRAIIAALRVPDGDFRDWDAVRAFADQVHEELKAEAAA